MSKLAQAIALNLQTSESVSTDSGIGFAMVEHAIGHVVQGGNQETLTERVVAVIIENAEAIGARCSKATRKDKLVESIKIWHDKVIRESSNYATLVYPPKGEDAIVTPFVTTKAPNKTHLNGSFSMGNSLTSIVSKLALIYEHKSLAVLKDVGSTGGNDGINTLVSKIRKGMRPTTALDTFREAAKSITDADMTWQSEADAKSLIALKAAMQAYMDANKAPAKAAKAA